MNNNSDSFDYIIVGAGSAGCILANRLSENSNTSVLLLETGGSDRSIFIQMPTALGIPYTSKRYNWGFESEPEPHLDGRRFNCPRGKVLGGSSSINGMVYVRGHACDFDEWEEHGAKGWGYRNCLPYFKKAESWKGGEDEYRGGSGPLGTNNGNGMKNPLYKAFIDAGVQAGYPETKDYNGYQQEGFGPFHMTVKDGVRASTANAYLQPILSRKNLKVVTHATVHYVEIENRTAIGVLYFRGKRRATARANREVVLSAGSIGSPTILQRSGIGPSHVLKDAAIDVICDLPGVGENLRDHLEASLQYECKQPVSLRGALNPINKLFIGARWFFFKSGLGISNHFESGGFIRSRAGVKWPNIQYHFLPLAMAMVGDFATPHGHTFQAQAGPNKPKSRGHVQITSSDIIKKPKILFNYLSAEQDRADFRDAVRLAREIFEQEAMGPFCGTEIQPGTSIQTDDEIDAWVRQTVSTAFHPSCTCKIGSDDDPLAVLNPDCSVRGIDRLRVVDASVFPTIPNGNLNAPTIMVAEKAADMILGKTPLPPSNAPVWIDPNWETCQRLQGAP
jgi:choline dehydrogenase